MLNKTFIIIGAILLLSFTMVLQASELKTDMDKLASDVSAMQMGFLTNDKSVTLSALDSLQKHVKQYLGDKDTITKLLPDDLKYKSSIAINSATLIERNAKKIKATLNDRSMRMINKQMSSQKAFLDIQNQCFRCHNLVRDWH